MLLFAHIITGAVIGQELKNPVIISGLAFTSHFALDMIPHWNYDVPKKLDWWEYGKVTPDFIASSAIYLAYIYSQPQLWLAVSLGVFFAALPDFLTLGKYVPFLNRFLKPVNFIHDKLQRHSDNRHRIARGLLYQILYIIILLYISAI